MNVGINRLGSAYPLPCALAGRLLGSRKSPTWMYCAMGSPWSPATPGAKYCGAFTPPEAVSDGNPGSDSGMPGWPGFAVISSSWLYTRFDGSVAGRSTLATTVVVDDERPATDPSNRVYSQDRKSTRLNSSHSQISYAVFCLKK